jgi:hypothetical protein
VVAVTISVAFGTPLRLEQAVGGVLVMAGVALSQFGNMAELRRRKPG